MLVCLRLRPQVKAPLAINWHLVFQPQRLLRLASLNGNVVLRSICMMTIVTDRSLLLSSVGRFFVPLTGQSFGVSNNLELDVNGLEHLYLIS